MPSAWRRLLLLSASIAILSTGFTMTRRYYHTPAELPACKAPCGDASDGKYNREVVHKTALDEYVARPEDSYEWEDTGILHRGGLPLFGWKAHILRMTSQNWLTKNDTSCSNWEHHLAVITPRRLRYDSTVLLFIEGGSNLQGPPDDKDEKLTLMATLATLTHSITAVLYQVPNQPCSFPGDSMPNRYEDHLVAYTWRHFLDHSDETDWIIRLPMTKSAVRAMDTIQAFVKQVLQVNIANFVVAGASKRGWTTWLTSAVDERVIGSIPIVMDLLNFYPSMHHIYRSLGGWPYTFQPYFALNLTQDFELLGQHKLMAIIDPYVYRSRLSMPKLIVTTSNDEFFPIDDSQFFYNDLLPEANMLILPNTEHTLVSGLTTMVRSIAAFHASILDSVASPSPSSTKLSSFLEILFNFLIYSSLTDHYPSRSSTNQSSSTAFSVLLDQTRTMSGKWRHKLWNLHKESILGSLLALGARARPRYKVDLDRSAGRITVLATDKPDIAKLWAADTPKGSDRRDFRFAEADNGNCSTLRVVGGCMQPIVFKDKVLKPLSNVDDFWKYEVVMEPPETGFRAFYIEMQFKSLQFIRPPFIFTTQALILPDTYPFPDCNGTEASSCLGHLV